MARHKKQSTAANTELKSGNELKILVTGANGFVGQNLIRALVEGGHNVFALARSEANVPSGVTILKGDLLKPGSLPKLDTFDRAFYLVHGLKGDKKGFEFNEAMMAVNFINWIRPTAATLTYLGGLGDDDISLSPHLRSRHLTGSILGSSGLPLLEFRASIVLGDGSLSFEMIKAIAERLPFIPEMKLLTQPCQPLALSDLMKYLSVTLHREVKGHEIFEIGGPDIVSYGELLEMYAEIRNLRRLRVKVPDVETKVILKALDYSIPEYKEAGKKLAESLIYPTVVRNNRAREVFPDIEPLSARDAMEIAVKESKTTYSPLWEKDFLRELLSDKILTQSGLLSPELMKNLERVGKIRDLFTRKH
jgi:uncharacterized protein YbjT (DUF2867 family)